MEKFYSQKLLELETSISEPEVEDHYLIQQVEVVIHLIRECLSKVKERVLKRRFKYKKVLN